MSDALAKRIDRLKARRLIGTRYRVVLEWDTQSPPLGAELVVTGPCNRERASMQDLATGCGYLVRYDDIARHLVELTQAHGAQAAPQGGRTVTVGVFKDGWFYPDQAALDAWRMHVQVLIPPTTPNEPGDHTEARWARVVRRWEAKHRA